MHFKHVKWNRTSGKEPHSWSENSFILWVGAMRFNGDSWGACTINLNLLFDSQCRQRVRLFDTDYLWSLVISKSWQFAPPIARENNSNVLSIPTSCELKFPCQGDSFITSTIHELLKDSHACYLVTACKPLTTAYPSSWIHNLAICSTMNHCISFKHWSHPVTKTR